jgi:hypothetical protein
MFCKRWYGFWSKDSSPKPKAAKAMSLVMITSMQQQLFAKNTRGSLPTSFAE